MIFRPAAAPAPHRKSIEIFGRVFYCGKGKRNPVSTMGDTSFTIDPAWPWSEPGFGLPALGGVALLLVLLTVWTYLGVRGASVSRVLVILALRLVALAIAVLLVLRPSLASYKTEDVLP